MLIYIAGTYVGCLISFLAGMRVGTNVERRRARPAMMGADSDAAIVAAAAIRRTPPPRAPQRPQPKTVDVGRGMVWVERPAAGRGRPMTPVTWTR